MCQLLIKSPIASLRCGGTGEKLDLVNSRDPLREATLSIFTGAPDRKRMRHPLSIPYFSGVTFLTQYAVITVASLRYLARQRVFGGRMCFNKIDERSR